MVPERRKIFSMSSLISGLSQMVLDLLGQMRESSSARSGVRMLGMRVLMEKYLFFAPFCYLPFFSLLPVPGLPGSRGRSFLTPFPLGKAKLLPCLSRITSVPFGIKLRFMTHDAL